MREWNLKAGDALALTLAADMRLSATDYCNDHIWELKLGSGNPAALAVHTTYGLRARQMCLFLRFSESGKTALHPAEFCSPPRLQHFYPNFLQLAFAPFEDLEVIAEYWVPESHTLAGRLICVNRTPARRRMRLELCGILKPLEGRPLAPAQQQMVNVLSGQSDGLEPLVFMSGGAVFGPGPYPSLALDLDFEPLTRHSILWGAAAEASPEASFDRARRAATRAWDAERARIELSDASQVFDIRTGDPDWDAALAFSQRAALALFYPPTTHLPHASFVQARQPDQGYSRSGDGRDSPPSWSGQSPLESYYLASLLPGAPSLKRGLLENFLHLQTEAGFIDHRPGLCGQRVKLLAMPLLASLAWSYYQETQDRAFLEQALPKLMRFFWCWFSPEHDEDADGLPAWKHPLQSGFEENPLFDIWHPWSQGVDPAWVRHPALEAMLYREAMLLLDMAALLGQEQGLGALRAQADLLRASVEAAWDERRNLYAYRDSLTRLSPAGRIVARHTGNGNLRPRIVFETPRRLLVEVRSKSPAPKRPRLEIRAAGSKEAGESETIEGSQFRWRNGGWVATSRRVYSSIGAIRIRGLEEKDRIVVRVADLSGEDMTLFTPLWAGIPSPERAGAMLECLSDEARFARPFGIPALPCAPRPQAEALAMSVYLPWNHLIGEGLLRYGFRQQAARLTERLMKAVIHNLKQQRAFYERYHAESGQGLGERGALSGLAPLGLFLQALGVRVISARRVYLEGQNPFAWPVTIQYRGLKIVRGLEATQIVFANGKVVTVNDTTPLVVSLDE